jgi:serine/threonine protein kinase
MSPNTALLRKGSWTNETGGFAPTHTTPLLGGRYRYVKKIGRGTFAVIVRAEDLYMANRTVAIKVMHVQFRALGEQEAAYTQLLAAAEHAEITPIVRCLDTFLFEEHCCIVFELLSTAPLKHCVEVAARRAGTSHQSPEELKLHAIRKVAAQLLSALLLLEREHFIHADIKPENILLVDDDAARCAIKVADLGNMLRATETEMSAYHDTFELQGLLYRAPEVMLGLPFSHPIDIWSVGCILAELYLGEPIFIGSDNAEVLAAIKETIGPLPYAPFADGKFASMHAQHIEQEATGGGGGNGGRGRGRGRGRTNAGAVDQLARLQVVSRIKDLLNCKDTVFPAFIGDLLALDPQQRATPVSALQHTFLSSLFPFALIMPSATPTPVPTQEKFGQQRKQKEQLPQPKLLQQQQHQQVRKQPTEAKQHAQPIQQDRRQALAAVHSRTAVRAANPTNTIESTASTGEGGAGGGADDDEDMFMSLEDGQLPANAPLLTPSRARVQYQPPQQNLLQQQKEQQPAALAAVRVSSLSGIPKSATASNNKPLAAAAGPTHGSRQQKQPRSADPAASNGEVVDASSPSKRSRRTPVKVKSDNERYSISGGNVGNGRSSSPGAGPAVATKCSSSGSGGSGSATTKSKSATKQAKAQVKHNPMRRVIRPPPVEEDEDEEELVGEEDEKPTGAGGNKDAPPRTAPPSNDAADGDGNRDEEDEEEDDDPLFSGGGGRVGAADSTVRSPQKIQHTNSPGRRIQDDDDSDDSELEDALLMFGVTNSPVKQDGNHH